MKNNLLRIDSESGDMTMIDLSQVAAWTAQHMKSITFATKGGCEIVVKYDDESRADYFEGLQIIRNYFGVQTK